MAGPVVVLAGGTGGAKLARGMLDVVGDDLVVIVNTGDDVEVHGAAVSPDPDLVTFWLADAIDERGWGLRRRHVRTSWTRCASSARRTRGSPSATATSRGAWSARGAWPTARRRPQAHAALTAALGVARAGAADVRRAGAHARAARAAPGTACRSS